MIKTTLKHWIYEICIEYIFSSIKRNFSVVPNAEILEQLRIGGSFNVIYYRRENGRIIAYHDPTVKGFIHSGAHMMAKITYLPGFSFMETDSDPPRRTTFLKVENIIEIL